MPTLRAKLEELIHVTGWPEDKQQIWLRKHNCGAWSEASVGVVRKAIEKLEFSAKMFNCRIDTSSGQVQDEM